MGLRDARKQFIEALREGRFSAEPREAQEETNLLAVGEVTAEFVIFLINRTKGHEYSTDHHDFDKEIEVHVFRPQTEQEQWYVKGYLISEDAVFISVHKSRHSE